MGADQISRPYSSLCVLKPKLIITLVVLLVNDSAQVLCKITEKKTKKKNKELLSRTSGRSVTCGSMADRLAFMNCSYHNLTKKCFLLYLCASVHKSEHVWCLRKCWNQHKSKALLWEGQKRVLQWYLGGGDHVLHPEYRLPCMHHQQQRLAPTVCTHIRLLLPESGHTRKT